MSNDDIREDIIHHMSRAFFACAWADYEDEHGEGTGGCEILSIMPDEIDPAAVKVATRLAERMETSYEATLPELLEKAKAHPYKYADRPCDEENFGFYAAMQAMGHGVGLESVCNRSAFPDFPYLGFHYCEFESGDYPISGE